MKKSWKTSLAGILGAFLFVIPQLQSCLNGQPCDWKQVGIGIAIGALGLSSKDHNVTGGTEKQ